MTCSDARKLESHHVDIPRSIYPFSLFFRPYKMSKSRNISSRLQPAHRVINNIQWKRDKRTNRCLISAQEAVGEPKGGWNLWTTSISGEMSRLSSIFNGPINILHPVNLNKRRGIHKRIKMKDFARWKINFPSEPGKYIRDIKFREENRIFLG